MAGEAFTSSIPGCVAVLISALHAAALSVCSLFSVALRRHAGQCISCSPKRWVLPRSVEATFLSGDCRVFSGFTCGAQRGTQSLDPQREYQSLYISVQCFLLIGRPSSVALYHHRTFFFFGGGGLYLFLGNMHLLS
jgi:hypothetical protein